MKRFLLSLFAGTAIISTINGQFTKIGGGLAYSSGFYFNNSKYDEYRSGHIAASFKGIYEITLPVHVSPSYTIFFPHKTESPESEVKISSMMFDINGHYVFNSLDRFEFYGLLGLDILLAWQKSESVGAAAPFKENDNAMGLNLGAGSYIKIMDQFDVYCEAKYIISKYDQFMFNAGVLINLDWLIKHENTGM